MQFFYNCIFLLIKKESNKRFVNNIKNKLSRRVIKYKKLI